MEIARIEVSGNRARAIVHKPITKGIMGAQVRLVYTDPMWDGLVKTVAIRGSVNRDILNAGEIIRIPKEVVAQEGAVVRIGICGTDLDENLLIPTLWAVIGTVKEGAELSGDTTTDDSLPAWAQIESKIGSLAGLNTQQKGSLVEAINEVLDKSESFGTEETEAIYQMVEAYLAANPPTAGEVDEQTIRQMVEAYLAENPPESGDAPVKGTDYWTAEDKAEIVQDVLAALPTWEGGSY